MKTLFDEMNIKIGAGTWQMGMKGWGSDYNENDVRNSLSFLIRNGINFIDTAEIYGHGESERNVGQVLRDLDRKKVAIATKIAGSNFRKNKIRKSLENSLRRLNTDYIDLYQVHWEPSTYTNIRESFRELENLAKEGLIHHIGVSNFTADKIKIANEVLKEIPIESNQIKYNIIEFPPEKELEFLTENNIKIIAWSPLAQGFLTGKYDARNNPTGYIRKINALFKKGSFEKFLPLLQILREEANNYHVPVASLVLAYEIQKGVIPIPGFKNEKQASDIINALKLNLNETTMERIEDESNRVKIHYRIGFYPPYLPNFLVNFIVRWI